MNRLWVRLSLMISGVLFLVFFLQFAEIMFSDTAGRPDIATSQRQSCKPRLVISWACLCGRIWPAGLAIGRVVSAPITALARAARQVGERGTGRARPGARQPGTTGIWPQTFNKMAAALQQAETARNNLMADVSHELRTPLTVLEGNLRAALDRVQALGEADIANLYAQTRHLIRLVNDLRELSLAETGQLTLEKTPTDLRLLVQKQYRRWSRLLLKKKCSCSLSLPQMPPILLDSLRIRQVLFNLLSNAMRHTPPGGVIRVKGAYGRRD